MPSPTHPGPDPTDLPIAIIGAGFAGIGSAIRLKQAGIDSFTMFERAGEIGGTWRDNTYPGAACDVPSHVYSFSFELNPDWSRAYAESHEIQAYLLRCVEKHGLRPHLRLGTAIVEARFDEAAGSWTLTTSRGDRVTARVVISAVGGLVDPAYPDIPGLESFRGEIFHTARWNHDCDLEGKRVAVIGTGASAVQVVPALASLVEKLCVYQRTAAWVMPKRDGRISERAKRLFRRHPALMRAWRWLLFATTEAMGPMVVLDAPRLKRLPQRASLRHLARSVSDPELRRKLTPHFQFGCKRVLISDDYWSSFERDDVELVTEGIAEISEDSIATRGGAERPTDLIVLATGFALGLATAPFPIFGRGGRSLDQAWSRGATAYKGVSVAGFPNWFFLMGPNTGPGHTSVLVYTEAQIAYALQAIGRIRSQGLRWVEVRDDVQERYNRGLQRRMPHTAWLSGCHSWYLGSDGANHSLYPGFASEYCLRTRRFVASEYQIAV